MVCIYKNGLPIGTETPDLRRPLPLDGFLFSPHVHIPTSTPHTKICVNTDRFLLRFLSSCRTVSVMLALYRPKMTPNVFIFDIFCSQLKCYINSKTRRNFQTLESLLYSILSKIVIDKYDDHVRFQTGDENYY